MTNANCRASTSLFLVILLVSLSYSVPRGFPSEQSRAGSKPGQPVRWSMTLASGYRQVLEAASALRSETLLDRMDSPFLMTWAWGLIQIARTANGLRVRFGERSRFLTEKRPFLFSQVLLKAKGSLCRFRAPKPISTPS